MEEFVTTQDHLNGYKDVPVVDRAHGRALILRLTAPSRHATRALNTDQIDFDQLVAICQPKILPDETSEGEAQRDPDSAFRLPPSALLDTLTPVSAALVEAVAFVLTFGADAQKKMLALARNLDNPTTASAPNCSSKPNSSPPATRGPKSPLGAIPNSNSTSPPPTPPAASTSSSRPSPSGSPTTPPSGRPQPPAPPTPPAPSSPPKN